MMMRNSFAVLLLLLPSSLAAESVQGPSPSFTYEIVTAGLEHPWSLAFLPDGRMLVTERPGRLRLISAEGELHPDPIGGLPPIRQHGQGGLLDVVLHPDFENNRWVYFTLAEADGRDVGTAVARGQLRGHRLEQVEVIFRLLPKSRTKLHFGSRLLFDKHGYLFITLGDRGDRLLEDELGRIRDVRQGPDGLLYLLTDDSDGLLVRLLPGGSG